jgi:hypothetical protein
MIMVGQKISPFDFLNSINTTKKNLMIGTDEEKQYVPFVVNRTLSYFQDTVGLANAMNIHHHIDNRLQYDFFINIVRKQKRFSKWVKPTTYNDVEVIKEYYGYNDEKARQVIPLLSSQQLEFIKNKVNKGGRK